MQSLWWRNALIYQIYPRSFQDSNGDGIGDLPGITRHLGHVTSLGADAIWIGPFYKSPMKDAGYDVADYCNVDPIFGTLADFDALLAKAHGLGLKVMIDMVWSHTSDEHPWFQNARKGINPDYYVWADPKPDGTPPNNWLSIFGGPAWSWDSKRRQYYLHHFLSCQPALNWRNPKVVAAIGEIAKFWLSRGVDGFRLDAVDLLVHDEKLRDNPPRKLEEVPIKLFGMQNHLYDMIQPLALDFLGRINQLVEPFGEIATMGELSSVGDPVARVANYTAPGRLSLAYTLGLMRRNGRTGGFVASVNEVQEKARNSGFVWAFSNHDVERVVSRWGDGSPQAAQCYLALLLSLPGAICLYQGEELGLTEVDLALDQIQDPFGRAYWPEYKGRDGCRTPMPWHEGLNGGFSDHPPWLPVAAEHLPLAVSRQLEDEASTLNVARRLVRFRKSHPALCRFGIEICEEGDILILKRGDEKHRLYAAFNLSPNPSRLAIQGQICESQGVTFDSALLLFQGWGFAFWEGPCSTD